MCFYIFNQFSQSSNFIEWISTYITSNCISTLESQWEVDNFYSGCTLLAEVFTLTGWQNNPLQQRPCLLPTPANMYLQRKLVGSLPAADQFYHPETIMSVPTINTEKNFPEFFYSSEGEV